MIGSQGYFQTFLKGVIPSRWFGDSTPVLDAVLAGCSAAWERIYSNITYVRQQGRLKTATDIWLDLIGEDFFGAAMRRRAGESDARYRARLDNEIHCERGTRAALTAAIRHLEPRSWSIFEPANCNDTGGYYAASDGATAGGGGVGYGRTGGWGSLKLPFQVLVSITLPPPQAVAVSGAWNYPAGGYGTPELSYGTLKANDTEITPDEVYSAIRRTLPAAVTAWVHIN